MVMINESVNESLIYCSNGKKDHFYNGNGKKLLPFSNFPALIMGLTTDN